MTPLDQITELYSDPDVVVINKPAGVMVHPDTLTTKEPTLIDWIKANHPEMEGVGEPFETKGGSVDRPGIVHRLDRDTSGVLILARTEKAHAYLKEAFMQRDVAKTYRAFVYGTLRAERGTIDRPIGKSRSDFRQWSAQRNPRGAMREAQTDYKVLARGDGVTYVEVFPKTGRTHQIRVHFKALQHAVVCDQLYAAGKPPMLDFTRLALHAKALRLKLPSGKEMTFEAPLPADFVHAEGLLKEPS
jgi:23S rRNA pseudouridine1911/1915/1917 synthase